MLKSIHEVHKMGVVHNDIKPNNFMLKREMDRLVIKLIDFGASIHMNNEIKRHVKSVGYSSP
jgi:serine/threonine protein kinase